MGLTYDLPFATESKWSIHAGANYQGTAETDVYNTPNTQMQARLLLDASLTYHDKVGRWTVTPWVSNITDKIYRVAGRRPLELHELRTAALLRSDGQSALRVGTDLEGNGQRAACKPAARSNHFRAGRSSSIPGHEQTRSYS